MHLYKYIEKIDSEITKLIERESMKATTSGERDLHYLFENRKHAIEWMQEKNKTTNNPGYYPKREAAAENETKSYFGG